MSDPPPATGQHSALIALGANLGDRGESLDTAARAIADLPSTTLLATSEWLATAPVGGPADQGEFLNGAVRVNTELTPEQLLGHLNGIEADAGRQRRVRWAARPLDLDLLLFDDLILAAESLTVPHPRMTFRPFVMQPAVEVAEKMRHPVLRATLGDLLDQLQTGEEQILVRGEKGLCRRVVELLPVARRERTVLDSANTSRPKLQIIAGEDITPVAAPTLWLDPNRQDRWPHEIEAAIECVWPETE